MNGHGRHRALQSLLALVLLALALGAAGCYAVPEDESADGGATGDAGDDGEQPGDDAGKEDGGETQGDGGGKDAGKADGGHDGGIPDAGKGDAGGNDDAGPFDAGDPCAHVTCGANASCAAGSCACEPGFEGDPYAGCTPIQTTELRVRQELVKVATAELGYCESDGRPYMLSQPGLWCYDFVAWVYQTAGNNLALSIPTPLYLPNVTPGAYPQGWAPEAGDLIKFTIQHYGMVELPSPDGNVINTIEGNVNYCVMKRSVSLGEISYFGALEGQL